MALALSFVIQRRRFGRTGLLESRRKGTLPNTVTVIVELGLPRSMLTIHVPPETLPAVHSMIRVFFKPVEGLDVLER